MILLPVHPDLQSAAAPVWSEHDAWLRTLVQRYDGLLLDARTLLSAQQFADAVHAAPDGRRALSLWLGDKLPAAPERTGAVEP